MSTAPTPIELDRSAESGSLRAAAPCPAEWMARAQWLFVLGTVLVLSFTGSDWLLFGSSPPFWWLLTFRVALATGSLWLVVRLRRPVRALWLENAVSIWLLVVAAYCLLILLSRPTDTLAPFFVNAVLATFLCIVYPLPTWKGMMAPAAIAIGSLLAFELREVSTDRLMTMALMTTYLVGPIAGGVIGAAIRRAELGLMISLEREHELRRELDEALEELSTVEGIVGICLHCKRLRDRRDEWQPIERLLTKVSRVRFSHGICPRCLDERYRDEHAEQPMTADALDS